MKVVVNRILLAISGMILLAIGVNVLIVVNLGLSPFDSLTYFFQYFLNIKAFGNASLFLHLCFVIPLLMLLKLKLESIIYIMLSIVSVFIFTRFVNLFSFITLMSYSTTSVKLCLFVIGFIVLSLGILLIAKANLIIPPYDKTVVELANRLNKNVGTMRLYCDLTILITAYIFAKSTSTYVPFSIGTFIVSFGTGLMMEFEMKIMRQISKISKH